MKIAKQHPDNQGNRKYPQARGPERREDAVTPAYELRVPPAVLASILAVFAVYLFSLCWKNFPMFPYIFQLIRDSWRNDSAKLFPVFPGFLVNWGLNSMGILVLGVFEAVSWGAGRQAVRWGLGRVPGGLTGFLFSIAIGNGIIGTMALGLGLNGLIGGIVFAVLLGVPFLLILKPYLLRGTGDTAAGRPSKRAGFSALGRVEWVLLGFCIFICGYNLLSALQPEWFYDSLVYHLALPSRWITEHRICHLPDTFIASYPLLQEMQYLVFISLGIDIPARLLHWLNGIECMAGVYLMARPVLGRNGAMLAAAIFASLPPIRFLHYITMVELGLSRYTMLALFAFMTANKLLPAGDGKVLPRRAWLLLCAWCLGLGHATKFLGIFVSIIVIGQLAIDAIRTRSSPKKALGDAALIIAWASVWTLPWLFKNWLFAGNPVFPMLGRYFPTNDWDENINNRWMKDNTRYGTGRGSLSSWLLMPVMASVGTREFGTFSLNPFFLLFLPLLVFVARIPPAIKFMAGSTAVYFVMWSLSSQQTRFMIPISTVASVATAFVVSKAFVGRMPLQLLAWAASGWIFIDSFAGEAQNRLKTRTLVPLLSGRMSREDFLAQSVTYYRTAEMANKIIPKYDRVVFMGGGESYHVKSRVICPSPYDKSAVGELAKRATTTEELRLLFRRKRVTHIMYNEYQVNEFSPYGIFDWGNKAQAIFIDFLSRYGKLVLRGDGVYLFSIQDRPIPAESRKTGKLLCFYPPENIGKVAELAPRANKLVEERKYGESLALVNEMIALLPEYTQGFAYRAYIHECMQDTGNSLVDYKAAVRMGYPPITAYLNLGLLYEKKKLYREAFAAYREAVEIEPGYTPARERYAEIAAVLGQNDLALELFSGLAKLSPEKTYFADMVQALKARK